MAGHIESDLLAVAEKLEADGVEMSGVYWNPESKGVLVDVGDWMDRDGARKAVKAFGGHRGVKKAEWADEIGSPDHPWVKIYPKSLRHRGGRGTSVEESADRILSGSSVTDEIVDPRG